MKRLSNPRLIAIFTAAAVLLAALALLVGRLTPERPVARVYLDGELYAAIDLSAVGEPYTLPVGEGNVLLIEPGAVSMQSADCPDGLCLRQGRITGGGYPIVCLPNRVSVEISSGGGIDAVTGG